MRQIGLEQFGVLSGLACLGLPKSIDARIFPAEISPQDTFSSLSVDAPDLTIAPARAVRSPYLAVSLMKRMHLW